MRPLRKKERALIEGNWFEHSKGTHTFGDIAIGIGLVAGAGASAYGASKTGKIANAQEAIAFDQMNKQDTAFSMLQDLISDPAKFFSNPVFTASLDQGSKSVARMNASQFGPNSGNEKIALQTFGQTFAGQQLFQQEELLAGMSGTGFNPGAAMGGALDATKSQVQNLNSLAGMIGFFGGAGGGSPGTAAPQSVGTPNAPALLADSLATTF